MLCRGPAEIEQIWRGPHSDTRTGAERRALGPLLREGPILARGEAAREWRRVLASLLGTARQQALGAAVDDATDAMLDGWVRTAGRDGAILDVAAAFEALTTDILGRTLLGSLHDESVAPLYAAIFELGRAANRRMAALVPLLDALPTPAQRRERAAQQTVESIAARLARRILGPDPPGDCPLVEIARGRPEGWVRDLLASLTFAGLGTTATALSWSLWSLGRHPEWIEPVRAGAQPETGALLQEVLRLHPPVWLAAREATEDAILGEHPVPRGTALLVSLYALHRHPDCWPEPDRFDPRRFLEGSGPIPGSFLPFGAGPRACTGRWFATFQIERILPALLARIRPEPVLGADPTPGRRATLAPRDLTMRIMPC